jgi:Phage integrase family/Phage integrase, N-terminal SAM-like domain
LNATRRFAEWCEAHGLHELANVEPFHVAAFVKELQCQFSAPTVKQHLAALRILFDWLVTSHVIEANPAHAVRGPRYVVTKGKTPVLAAAEARAVLDAIDTGTLTGLRDRALIGVMIYTLVRVNAVIGMKVKDYFTQGRRGWARLHEKGGKEHEVPCHHSVEKLLDEYIAGAGIAGDSSAPMQDWRSKWRRQAGRWRNGSIPCASSSTALPVFWGTQSRLKTRGLACPLPTSENASRHPGKNAFALRRNSRDAPAYWTTIFLSKRRHFARRYRLCHRPV